MFLSEYIAPATLQITEHVTRQATSNTLQQPSSPNIDSLHVTRGRLPRLDRQWTAFLNHVGGQYTAKDVAAILTELNWAKISNVPDACIVEVSQSPKFSIFLISIYFLYISDSGILFLHFWAD